MGCDCEVHVEVMLNGRWQHYSTFDAPRDYRLFTKMATWTDVRAIVWFNS